jgi:glycosyltransferase involved in cell wall biosynthesis
VRKLLFIGSFPEHSQGGTSTASLSLKEGFEEIGWEVFPVDSTISDVKRNRIQHRILRGFHRRKQIAGILSTHTPTYALIFCGHGLSFLEKGIWLRYLKSKGLKVALAPRSGLILKNFAHPVYRLFMKKILRSAPLVLCQGKYWTNFYSQFDASQPEKFHTLHNWVDAQKYSAGSKTQRSETFRIAIVGWIKREKGLADIIPIAEGLQSGSKREFRIDLYGKGPDEEYISKLIAKSDVKDRIQIHAWMNQTKIQKILRQSDCLLFLSRFEGMANTLLEAQIAGLPIVATNINTNPELIDDGINGFMHPPGDHASFIRSITELMNNSDLHQQMSQNAIKKAANYPTPTQTAKYIQEAISQ